MPRPCPNKRLVKKREGFVLVAVLIMGAMLITCATAFAWFARMQIKTTSREKISLNGRSMAQVLALEALKWLKASPVDYDSPVLEWFRPIIMTTGDRETWVLQIVPLDDKVPLGNLFLPDGTTLREDLSDVWDNIWVKLKHLELANVVLDFLDEDTKPRSSGSERPEHINRAILDISELLLIEGMTADILYGVDDEPGLADYCTLWSDGKINMNMAPIEVMELLPGMGGNIAFNISNYRQELPIANMDGLAKIPGFPARSRAALMNTVTFASRYFMINIEMLEGGGGGTSFGAVLDKTTGTIVRWEEF